MRWKAVVLVLALAGFGAAARVGAAEAVSLAQVEKNVCRTNLDLIGQAILAYRTAKQALPDQLSDLVPEFLDDPKVLFCPTSVRTGVTSHDTAEYTRAEVADLATSYVYEFRTNAIPKIIGRGSRRSMREWKQLQMGLLGSEVPIVRCVRLHDRCLNLSFGGRLYESGLMWEAVFTHLVKPAELTFTRLFAQGTTLRVIAVPPRAPDTPDEALDLSAYFNADLAQTGSWERPEAFLTGLPLGFQTLNGVGFDVRGRLQLWADAAWLDAYPQRVQIPLGQRARRLHFLHAAMHGEQPQTEIGRYGVSYEDGRTNQFPVLFGGQLAHWRPEANDVTHDDFTQVAWTGTNVTASLGSRRTRLYHTKWDNPLPEVRIRSLEVSSAKTKAGPFVIAITLEP
jgi:hypothetical protein